MRQRELVGGRLYVCAAVAEGGSPSSARRIQRLCVALLLGVWLTACSDPIPISHDKLEYVGLWVASDRYISLFANGRMEYKKKLSLGFHNRSTGNFTFRGNELETGRRSFFIDRPPIESNGQWTLVLNGTEYHRIGPPAYYGRSTNWPNGIE